MLLWMQDIFFKVTRLQMWCFIIWKHVSDLLGFWQNVAEIIVNDPHISLYLFCLYKHHQYKITWFTWYYKSDTERLLWHRFYNKL